MNKEEFDRKILEIENECSIKKRDLSKTYALSNNPYNINDIIQDHYQIIKIEKINCGRNYVNPECIYDGPLLKKNLTPFKNEEKSRIWQSNVKKQL